MRTKLNKSQREWIENKKTEIIAERYYLPTFEMSVKPGVRFDELNVRKFDAWRKAILDIPSILDDEDEMYENYN